MHNLYDQRLIVYTDIKFACCALDDIEEERHFRSLTKRKQTESRLGSKQNVA